MNIEKIIIHKNIIRYGRLIWEFSNEDEIIGLLITILINNTYNTIHVYKRVPGHHKPAIKVCMFTDETGDKDLLIICEKKYVNTVKDVLKSIDLVYSKPNGGINKKVLK